MWFDTFLDLFATWTDAARFTVFLPTSRIVDPKDEWFYVREWQQAEREAEGDVRAGRYEDFADMDQVITVLKENDPTTTARLDQVDRVALALRRFRRKK